MFKTDRKNDERGGCGRASSTARRGERSRKHPCIYKGVRKRRGGRWVSEIREPGKKSRIWLGTFSTAEKAARAYDTAAFNLRKPYAFLNFPDSVSSLPLLPLSTPPKQIQEAAALAAAAFEARSFPAGGSGVVPTDVAPPTLPPYFDEDVFLNMPSVLIDMAQGLMITPSFLNYGIFNGDDLDYSIPEISLWHT